MMLYEEKKIRKAFVLFLELASTGYLEKEKFRLYHEQDDIQGLLEHFADEAESALIAAGEKIYLVPKTMLSPFHMKNEQIRRELGMNAQNLDVYTMYFCLLVFIGTFYHSFHSTSMQRDFLTMDQWLLAVNERLDSLRQQKMEVLQQAAIELKYNWLGILERWDSWNDIKESSNTQKGNTISRMSFLYKVVQFMENQGIVEMTGVGEYAPTAKCQIIVQRYFMETEHNQRIFRFIYQDEEVEEDGRDF